MIDEHAVELRVAQHGPLAAVIAECAVPAGEAVLRKQEDVLGPTRPGEDRQAAVTRLAARKAALRRHIWGPDKGGK